MIIIVILATTLVTLTFMALSFGFGSAPEAGARISLERLPLALIIHLATILPALLLGAYVLIRRKGDRRHKLLGKIWVALMVTTAMSVLWLGESWSFIHLFSLLVFISIPRAIWAIRAGNVIAHQRAMQGMYIGSVVAGVFALLPGRLLGTLMFG
jgi:uncharacterized membrane protein